MISFSKQPVLLLILLLHVLLASISSTSGWSAMPPRITVIVNNDLDNRLDLTVHCKSKNDDLGERHLPYHNSFQFSFRPNFWGRTVFFCSMHWPPEHEIYWFDIYVTTRDRRLCKERCSWNIKPRGPCLFNDKTMKFDICLPWLEG
ncbi:hypothetical protein CICLE_v10007065mg [Citrus x clementina]|uniref:S-protein homolog n=2 Tax=Citrus TaxID=2706 RepID=V4S4P0_CITCL|nr:hypothetical protein CICLE_v10007065mg [Citrus x clementina]